MIQELTEQLKRDKNLLQMAEESNQAKDTALLALREGIVPVNHETNISVIIDQQEDDGITI